MKAPARKSVAKAKAAPVEGPRDPGRFVSQDRLAKVLDRNRATIREWDAAGMPCVRRGDRDAGAQWLYDVAEVVKWREGQVSEKARKEGRAEPRMPSAGGGDLAFVGDLEPKERISLAMQIMKMGERQRALCTPMAVEEVWTRAFRDVGNSVMSIPELCARDMVGFPDEVVARFRKTAKEKVADVLKATAGEFAKNMAEMTATPAPVPPSEDDEDEAAE